MASEKPLKRILLKISGEMLLNGQSFGIDQSACQKIASAFKAISEEGHELAVVIGGGNIFRGINLNELGMQRTPADQMGMLATLINGLAIQQALSLLNCKSKILTALECPRVAETFHWSKALDYLASGDILLFVGGTGNPYFTTDSAAAMRACEIHADIFLKATKVDGIFNKDPKKHRDATKYDQMSYSQVLAEKLQVMDATSIAICQNNKLPILVFNMDLLGKVKLADILTRKNNIGTLVKGD